MSDTPAPPPADPAPPPEPPDGQRPPWLPIAIAVAAALVLGLGVFALRGAFVGGAGDESAYTIAPYTPPTELITARDRVMGYAEPDMGSEVLVMFGEGVTLNVNGRVARGLGNDWYSVAWNEQTAFVRQQDVVTGSGAPPAPEVREREEEELEEERKPDPFEVPSFPEIEPQPSPPPSYGLSISDVRWVREPNARDFARYFPSDALDEGQSGRVTLDCIIARNGRLDCSVASESPSGYGFGRAALSISRQVRVDPTLPDGSPAAGRHLSLPLNFRAG